MREHELTTLLKVICFVVRNSIHVQFSCNNNHFVADIYSELEVWRRPYGGCELLLTQILDQSVIFKKFRTTID